MNITTAMQLPEGKKVKRVRRILFVSPTGQLYGGGERSGFEFCKFLGRNGYEVITAIPKTSVTYRRILEDNKMVYQLLDCGEFESQILESNSVFPKIVTQLVNIIKDKKIDIVITNLYAQSGPVAAILSGVPNISMDRGQAYDGDYFADFMARFSDGVIVNSMGLADIYKEKYGIATPVAYSYTSVPKVGLDKNIHEQRIVCVSRISPEKNLLQVLRAVDLLKKRQIFDGKVLIIGPTTGGAEEDYKDSLVKYAADNDLTKNIEWLGNQADPWQLVGENDIYLNTSDKESIGRSSIEAIKLGLPAILVDIPGHKDIFEKIGAIKYRRNQTEDLADKIEYVIKNYAKVKIDCEKARRKAEEVINEQVCHGDALVFINKLTSTSISSDTIFNYVLNLANTSRRHLGEQKYEYDKQLEIMRGEVASFLGVRRSARLFVGNVKRRVKKGLK